jgi:hypothetical protein
MKTSLKITALLLVATIISLSSFTYKRAMTKRGPTGWEEYNQVIDYVRKNVCTPISKMEGNASVKMSSFSRCPSGYQPQVAGNHDSAKVDRFVFGKVRLYKGCNGNNVCDFKVFVNKNITLIRSNDKAEYVTVNEWLAAKKTKELPPVKEKETQVEG